MLNKVNIVLSNNGQKINSYTKVDIQSGSLYDEKWLQKIIFENISLINVIDPIFSKIKIIPLCREFSLNDTSRNVYLDILAITELGKLVLIECKLWKNPQSRREVVAQLIEYASLMRKLSFSDLSGYLKKYISNSENPIQEMLKKNGIDFSENDLVDSISESLKLGDFHLVIVGDGIRSDIQSISETLNAGRGLMGDLSLVEVPVHKDEAGNLLITSRLPFKTETIKKVVYVNNSGDLLSVEDEANFYQEPLVQKVDMESIERSKSFWNDFIDSIVFDHPDQSKPRLGGRNWVRINFPEPIGWVSSYRYTAGNFIGVNARVDGDISHLFFNFLNDRIDFLKNEIDPNIQIEYDEISRRLKIACSLDVEVDNPNTFDLQKNWLMTKLNSYVNILRPLIKQFTNQIE